MHARTFARPAQAWRLTGDVYSKKPGDKPWISEMYGYSFGAAKAGVWHKYDEESMLYPGYMPSGVHMHARWRVWDAASMHVAVLRLAACGCRMHAAARAACARASVHAASQQRALRCALLCAVLPRAQAFRACCTMGCTTPSTPPTARGHGTSTGTASLTCTGARPGTWGWSGQRQGCSHRRRGQTACCQM